MRYGIVGASGTLGRVVVRYLLKGNATDSVNALVRRPDEQLQSLAGCRLVTGGLFDAAGVDDFARNSDVIVNLAARNPGVAEEDDADQHEFYAINALGAGIVAAAARRWGKPVVHFSSVAVYETGQSGEGALEKEADTLPANDTRMREFHDCMVDDLESRLAPGSANNDVGVDAIKPFLQATPCPADAPLYGLSKLVGETLVGRLAGQSCAIRMSDVYGPGHESRGVVTDHLNALRDDDRVVVDFDFRSSAFFVYIDDVCRLIVNVAEKAARAERLPEILNFCGPRVTEEGFRQTLAELARRHRLESTVALSDGNRIKFDRRYSSEAFAACFENFAMTAFADGLETTWREFER